MLPLSFCTAIELTAQQIVRHREALGECHILELDEETLAMRSQRCDVVQDWLKGILIARRLQLAPTVAQLRPRDRRVGEECRLVDARAIATEVDELLRRRRRALLGERGNGGREQQCGKRTKHRERHVMKIRCPIVGGTTTTSGPSSRAPVAARTRGAPRSPPRAPAG